MTLKETRHGKLEEVQLEHVILDEGAAGTSAPPTLPPEAPPFQLALPNTKEKNNFRNFWNDPCILTDLKIN
ncbi:hypothetical protein TNCV_1601981 [Trichonephila clavipes]|nr:hypothetical protein TNCV_1601981 [Trichonephila clavipes]